MSRTWWWWSPMPATNRSASFVPTISCNCAAGWWTKRCARLRFPRRLGRLKLSSADSPRAKLTLHPPGLAVGLQDFSRPVEGVGRDLGKVPANGGAVGVGSNLNDVVAAPLGV